MKTINDHELSLDEAEPRDLIDNYLLAIREGKEGFGKEELVVSIFDCSLLEVRQPPPLSGGPSSFSSSIRKLKENVTENLTRLTPGYRG